VRGRDTLFGAGNFVNAEGKAEVPENWRYAENWYHDAMYGPQAFYPSGAYAGSDLLAGGNWFGSGNVAMVAIHQCIWAGAQRILMPHGISRLFLPTTV
jgi:multiple sugar transport system substrate-binding protein